MKFVFVAGLETWSICQTKTHGNSTIANIVAKRNRCKTTHTRRIERITSREYSQSRVRLLKEIYSIVNFTFVEKICVSKKKLKNSKNNSLMNNRNRPSNHLLLTAFQVGHIVTYTPVIRILCHLDEMSNLNNNSSIDRFLRNVTAGLSDTPAIVC